MQLTGAGDVGAYAGRGENLDEKEGSAKEDEPTMLRAISDAPMLLVTREVEEEGVVRGLVALPGENPRMGLKKKPPPTGVSSSSAPNVPLRQCNRTQDHNAELERPTPHRHDEGPCAKGRGRADGCQ